MVLFFCAQIPLEVFINTPTDGSRWHVGHDTGSGTPPEPHQPLSTPNNLYRGIKRGTRSDIRASGHGSCLKQGFGYIQGSGEEGGETPCKGTRRAMKQRGLLDGQDVLFIHREETLIDVHQQLFGVFIGRKMDGVEGNGHGQRGGVRDVQRSPTLCCQSIPRTMPHRLIPNNRCCFCGGCSGGGCRRCFACTCDGILARN